jgi:hypothetical protein
LGSSSSLQFLPPQWCRQSCQAWLEVGEGQTPPPGEQPISQKPFATQVALKQRQLPAGGAGGAGSAPEACVWSSSIEAVRSGGEDGGLGSDTQAARLPRRNAEVAASWVHRALDKLGIPVFCQPGRRGSVRFFISISSA